jgi:hypothetical protein
MIGSKGGKKQITYRHRCDQQVVDVVVLRQPLIQPDEGVDGQGLQRGDQLPLAEATVLEILVSFTKAPANIMISSL